MEVGRKTKFSGRSPLTSPNQSKACNHGKKPFVSPKAKFDFKQIVGSKMQGIRPSHRKSLDQKTNPHLKMLFNNDPLNLASLCDKTSGNQSPETSSPNLDRSHEFEPTNIIPIDISDPLNLNGIDVQLKPPRKKRRRKRRNTFNAQTNEQIDKETLLPLNKSYDLHLPNAFISPTKTKMLPPKTNMETGVTANNSKPKSTSPDKESNMNNKSGKRTRRSSKNKQFRKRLRTVSTNESMELNTTREFNVKNEKYKYGNCAKYYGACMREDQRLLLFQKSWFYDKDCLDIGCNTGRITCWLADNYAPKTLIGIDIDPGLINIARKFALNRLSNQKGFQKFPLSLEQTFGPILAPELDVEKKGGVKFIVENYIPSSDGSLKHFEPKYDTIVCLNVTKWVQLNFGDEGLKLMFKKIFLQLKPGGRLLLEPQSYKSYKEKKNLTANIRNNFNNMKLMPNDFPAYLLSSDVGFTRSQCLGFTKRKKARCNRPLYLLTKSDVLTNKPSV